MADWTSLVGSEKKKLINLLPDQLEINDILFPETKDTAVKLWQDFGFLYQLINQSSDNNPKLYLDVFSRARGLIYFAPREVLELVTIKLAPYMHPLAYHVPVFLKNHSSFKQFTSQWCGKNNDDAEKVFFQNLTNGMVRVMFSCIKPGK